jgi:hypothetical protein
MPTPSDPDFIGAVVVQGMVQKYIFSPYSGAVLDMRDAVVIDGTDNGKGIHVMSGAEFDVIEEAFFTKFSREDFDVYDGRDIFGK